MAISFPVPADDTYDYVPVAGRDVQAGDDILSLSITYGGVTVVTPPPDSWSYLLVSPEGEFGLGAVDFPADPGTMPDQWWHRTALWRRAAKSDDAATITVGASSWIYPAGEDGRMICYANGSGHMQGDRAFRGALLTSPADLWINDDPDWDWLPVADGAEVSEGDVVRGLTTAAGVVAEVFAWPSTEDMYGGAYFFGPEEDGSPLIGYYLEPPAGQVAWQPFNSTTLFRRLAKPAEGAKFRAPDGSRWIYTGGTYYCFGRGSAGIPPGAILLRGEIAGGLTPIT